MVLRICIVAAATLASLSAQQASSGPAIVYHAVGKSLRWSTLDAATGNLKHSGTAADLPAEIQYVAVHPARKALYASVSDRARANSIHGFAIEPKTGALSPLGASLALPDSLGPGRSPHRGRHRTLSAHRTQRNRNDCCGTASGRWPARSAGCAGCDSEARIPRPSDSNRSVEPLGIRTGARERCHRK